MREASGVDAARELPPEEPLGALGLDSLAIVNAVAAVEGRFGRELPDALWDDRRGISHREPRRCSRACGVRASPSGTGRPSPPYPSSRASRASSVSSSNSRGAAREARVAAGALHRTVIVAHWLRANQPCVVLTRDLDGDLPMSRCPRASRSPPTTALPTSRWQASGRGRKHRACAPISDGACREASIAWRPGRASASSPTTCSGRSGAEDVTTSPGTCFGLNLYERREARGRGIGLALLAASLPYTRDLGFARQATIVLERNRPMIAAATQRLGFTVSGSADRSELLGRVRWSWQRHGSMCIGPRLVI